MPPDDPTPLGDAMTHRFPNQKIPDPQPHADEAGPEDSGNPADTLGSADIAERPPLPDDPDRMAVDIEDEESDPVIDTGPGIADGVRGPQKQRG